MGGVWTAVGGGETLAGLIFDFFLLSSIPFRADPTRAHPLPACVGTRSSIKPRDDQLQCSHPKTLGRRRESSLRLAQNYVVDADADASPSIQGESGAPGWAVP